MRRDHVAWIAPKKLLELSGRGMQDLAGVAIHEVEAERGGPLTETTEHARTLLQVVCISSGIPVDEFALSVRDRPGWRACGRSR